MSRTVAERSSIPLTKRRTNVAFSLVSAPGHGQENNGQQQRCVNYEIQKIRLHVLAHDSERVAFGADNLS